MFLTLGVGRPDRYAVASSARSIFIIGASCGTEAGQFVILFPSVNKMTYIKNKPYWLYVLKQEEGKYYVGITQQSPEERYRQHRSGFAGAAWTKKYKPIKIFYKKYLGIVSKEKAELYENRVVRRYIAKYGINNVRGGDIRVTDVLVKRFGTYYSREDWSLIIGIALLIASVIIFGVAYIIK